MLRFSVQNRLRASLTIKPVDEPVTVAELRQHGRISGTADDAWLMAAIGAARDKVEQEIGRALIRQTWTAYLDRFPLGFVRLPMPPLHAIASVKYIDPNGAQQTLASNVYESDTHSTPARFGLAYGRSWPSTRDQMNAVEVAYTCGYGLAADDVPAPIRHAIMMIVAHLYEHRETVNDFQLHDIPMGASWLLDPYRVAFF
jgi:uncharacterized phiE125 gp8 family phage protein